MGEIGNDAGPAWWREVRRWGMSSRSPGILSYVTAFAVGASKVTLASPPPPFVMSDRSNAPDDRPPSERRQNLALRELIDEMMASIRQATQGSLWTSEERTQYERELAMIMARVRTQAVGPKDPVSSGS
jgi:hypothetical protein